MTRPKFSEGDLVQLKSGGPAMVVRELPSYMSGDYRCSWFRGAVQESGDFRQHELQSYLPPSK